MDGITIGHTPDMDDAFMFYALAEGKVRLDSLAVRHVIEDIQRLNERALKAELDVTAVSAAGYPAVAKDYWILSVGSSVGQNYGPLVVSMKPLNPSDLQGRRIAVPGLQTTAYLLLKLAVPGFVPVEMSFEKISDAVLNGQVEAGLLIHERQLTYRDQGLLPILDLGTWWHTTHHLPLPLGLNVVKRTLGRKLAAQIAKALRDSILFAMSHQDDAIQWSLRYGRGIDVNRARQFVSMYVNEETLALSRHSREALRLLYLQAAERELISSVPRLTIIEPPQ
ncbi:MAG: ABC transporter substrate-binding protein [Candidatus Omnitrophica bacterium]|nr:ABC transporter substrate-binding protein [Candidatus Omnitrophota bacterium]